MSVQLIYSPNIAIRIPNYISFFIFVILNCHLLNDCYNDYFSGMFFVAVVLVFITYFLLKTLEIYTRAEPFTMFLFTHFILLWCLHNDLWHLCFVMNEKNSYSYSGALFSFNVCFYYCLQILTKAFRR